MSNSLEYVTKEELFKFNPELTNSVFEWFDKFYDIKAPTFSNELLYELQEFNKLYEKFVFVKNLKILQTKVSIKASEYETSFEGKSKIVPVIVDKILNKHIAYYKANPNEHENFKANISQYCISNEYKIIYLKLKPLEIENKLLTDAAIKKFLLEKFEFEKSYNVNKRLDFYSIFIGFNGWVEAVSKKFILPVTQDSFNYDKLAEKMDLSLQNLNSIDQKINDLVSDQEINNDESSEKITLLFSELRKQSKNITQLKSVINTSTNIIDSTVLEHLNVIEEKLTNTILAISKFQNNIESSTQLIIDHQKEGFNQVIEKIDGLEKSEQYPKYLSIDTPLIEESEIIGRENDLEDLYTRLHNKKNAVVVNAMGGIGKTTLVAVYGTKYSDYYKHIVWVNQSSKDNFKNDLVNTQGLLDNLQINKDNKKIDDLFIEILIKLNSIEASPCLMIIDNAEEELDDFRNKLPKPPNWHILITSREKLSSFEQGEIKQLDFLSPQKAIDLFKKNYERDDFGSEVIQKIVEDLDYHTLAIEIIAKTARDLDTPPESILDFIKKDISTDVKVRHSNKKIDRITSYLCTTFKKLTHLDEEKKWLLVQLSCLPAKFHSYDQLKEFIFIEGNRKIDLRKNLKNLTYKGWLQYDKRGESFKLHRIIIEVINNSEPIDIEKIKPLFLYIMENIFETYNSKNNPKYKNENYILKCIKWVPYGKSISEQFKTLNDSIIIFINGLSLLLQDLGSKDDLLEAKKLLKKAVTYCIENFEEKHSNTTLSYYNLARILKDLGGTDNLLEAKFFLEKTIVLKEENHKELHPDIANNYSYLAMVLKDLGGTNNLLEAKKLLKKAVSLDEDNLGENDPSTAISYSDLAIVLKNLGGENDLLEAKRLLEKAIASDEKNFGKNHSSTAISYSHLAMVLIDLRGVDNLIKAKELLQKVVDSHKKNFGKRHPNIATSYSDLAIALKELGGNENLLNAKRLFEDSIEIYEDNFGGEDPKTIANYSNLAIVLKELGGDDNLFEAKKLLEKTIDSCEKTLGKNHFNTAMSYFHLAVVLRDFRDNKSLLKAKRLLEKSLKICEEILDSNHPMTINIRFFLKNLKR